MYHNTSCSLSEIYCSAKECTGNIFNLMFSLCRFYFLTKQLTCLCDKSVITCSPWRPCGTLAPVSVLHCLTLKWHNKWATRWATHGQCTNCIKLIVIETDCRVTVCNLDTWAVLRVFQNFPACIMFTISDIVSMYPLQRMRMSTNC